LKRRQKPDRRQLTEMADRDAKGRFIKGNKGNPNGRLPKEREIKYYELTKSNVSESDWTEIVVATVKLAKRGDNQARKWLSDYLIGVPAQKMDLTLSDKRIIVTVMDNIEGVSE